MGLKKMMKKLLTFLKLRNPETSEQMMSWNDKAAITGDLLGIFWNSKQGDDWEFLYIEMGDEERLI
jgi:hypothetical protein